MYTCVTKGSDDCISARVSGSMIDYIWAGKGRENRIKLIEKMSNPAIRMVTLTVTEKGYNADLTQMTLDKNLPANNWMISHSAGPRRALEAVTEGIAPHMTALSFITAALEKRRKAGVEPFTVMSCDNL